MARIRTIKPEFPEDEKLANVSRDARYLFVLLWTQSDDHGNFRASPALLKGKLYPYDADLTPTEVGGWLGELASGGRVLLYEVEGQMYGHVVNWSKHQRVDNAGKHLVPPPSEGNVGGSPQLSANRGGLPLDHDHDHDHDRLLELVAEPLWDRFPEWYSLYPKKTDKKDAEKAWKVAVRDTDPQEIIDGLRRQLDAHPLLGMSERHYVPGPGKWLRAGKWSDEVTAKPSAPRLGVVMENGVQVQRLVNG